MNRDGTLICSNLFYFHYSVLVYPGRTRLMFTCVFRRYVAATVLLVPTPFEGR